MVARLLKIFLMASVVNLLPIGFPQDFRLPEYLPLSSLVNDTFAQNRARSPLRRGGGNRLNNRAALRKWQFNISSLGRGTSNGGGSGISRNFHREGFEASGRNNLAPQQGRFNRYTRGRGGYGRNIRR